MTIPVRLHRAARRERLRFRNVYRTPQVEEDEQEQEPPVPERAGVHALESAHSAAPARREAWGVPAFPPAGLSHEPETQPRTVSRVRNAPVSGAADTPVSRSEILKGYETAPGAYAVLKPSEIAALRPKPSTELEISSFVKPAEISTLFLDASYYVWPDKGGERPYALLYAALSESHFAALGTLAMHGREYSAAIFPGSQGLILHTLFHANETHSEEEYAADASLVSGKELEMARSLVSALAAPFDASALKDKYEERLRALVESREGVAHEAGPPAPRETRKSPPDLLDALRKSLESVRKPVRRETGARSRQNRARTPKRSRKAG